MRDIKYIYIYIYNEEKYYYEEYNNKMYLYEKYKKTNR